MRPPYFQEIENGNKTFELRFNDRDFRLEDVLILKEYYLESDSYSGRDHSLSVEWIQTYSILYPEALKEGYIIMAEQDDFDIFAITTEVSKYINNGLITDSMGYERKISYILYWHEFPEGLNEGYCIISYYPYD